ncbi:MAG: DUF6371 domain-containing protein [Prevotella sp.]|jgi:hypothetical protein|nr:DUF6371 domain-containing protein [Prevotella sp.]MCI1281109.1 DUF6371 domain-containing protein [Prevotella sp.]
MIDSQTIDRIKEVANIVDVISDYVELKKCGVSYKGICPFHNERTPSFFVLPSRQIYHCFGCGKGGDVINFIMEMEKLPYPDAVKFLARRYNLDVYEDGARASTYRFTPYQATTRQEPPQAPSYINKDIVYQSQSTQNNLIYYLCGYFTTEELEKACALYYMGSTRNGSTIYWQIDEALKVRSGKVIAYDGDTGHRIKESGVNWAHSIMRLQGFNLVQCLYGQHLLKAYPDKPVRLVEGEKTAFICSMVYPKFNWLSCGGFDYFKPDMLQALEGRDVEVYPDTDTTGETFTTWKAKSEEMTFAKFMVSDFCERYATQQQKKKKFDIADLLLADMEPIASDVIAPDELDEEQCQKPMTDAEKALKRMIQANPVIGTLVDNLNLELVV